MKWRNQVASIATLSLEEAARRAPSVSFIHSVPGVVKSGIKRDAEGFGLVVIIALSSLLEPFIQTPPLECGERHVFLATSAMYKPCQGGEVAAGVPLDGKEPAARGSNGQIGSGIYTLGMKGESAPPKVEQLLLEFRENGTAEKVWDSIATDFKEITGADTL